MVLRTGFPVPIQPKDCHGFSLGVKMNEKGCKNTLKIIIVLKFTACSNIPVVSISFIPLSVIQADDQCLYFNRSFHMVRSKYLQILTI